MATELIWDLELIKRYDQTGPRYTSYPTALQFSDNFGVAAYHAAAADSATARRPLSLYFHIPFCARVCYYCGCNKVVTKRREHAEPYLQTLFHEIEMQSALMGHNQTVEQLHWGGGTPTFLNPTQMQALMDKTAKHFNLVSGDFGDYSIELDPREADWSTIGHLRSLGFNRISIGVQDFNPTVQQAVNRVQSEEETRDVIDAARALTFKSINIDLIYGLPFQSCASFMETVDKVIEIRPDRLSVFNYAHMPNRFMPQRRINSEDLPSPQEKLTILENTITRLLDAGYVYIGMDHFALPDDDLALAQEGGTLHRNFQGYTTHSQCDLIGMGVSSISRVGNVYAQNHANMEEYASRVNNGKLAIRRGLLMNEDDRIRSAVINQLICHFRLDIKPIEETFGIHFQDYFADALKKLSTMAADGLIRMDSQSIVVEPRGRLLIRNICMQFDVYQQVAEVQRFSRVI
ncbi:oxygen-independent coproporphyrinogen III oxidase [Kistimonas scapharcae]|uniref:Coproporphyrinogen-III oxidase n=1 Tax=Kistimonas scapharcae TaxID=1036133 RepID=A0ABP8V1S9_9GAMM